MDNKTLIAQVSPIIHKEVKCRAAAQGLTVRAWLLQAVLEKIRAEKRVE